MSPVTSTSLLFKLRPAGRAAFVALALLIVSTLPAAAQLANPSFDSGPLGAVGNFAFVVGPPFHGGVWGAESGTIQTGTACATLPRTGPNLLSLGARSDVTTEAWQVIDVTGAPPTLVSVSAWGARCGSGAPQLGVAIRTYNSANGWPAHTLLQSASTLVDGAPGEWKQVSLNCVAIPGDTEWIMIHLSYVNSTLGGAAAYIDDVVVTFDGCPTPVETTTWGRLKALARAS